MLSQLLTSPIVVPMFLGTRESEIGPGIAGFIATFVMVTATIFLIRDMAKRIRRVRHRAMLEHNLDQPAFPEMTIEEQEAKAVHKEAKPETR